jgi:beta-phosphoglucomutase-like phosphatase (HAD superfamily)
MIENLERIKITTDKILFFDMDGTLVDTNLANFSAYKKALDSVLQTDTNLVYKPEIRFNRSVLRANFPHLTNKERLNRNSRWGKRNPSILAAWKHKI